jgi:hypothetical protein
MITIFRFISDISNNLFGCKLILLGEYIMELINQVANPPIQEQSIQEEKKVKILGCLLKILNNFLKEKYINFSVFRIFQDSSFLSFLQILFEMSLTCFDKLQVLFRCLIKLLVLPKEIRTSYT